VEFRWSQHFKNYTFWLFRDILVVCNFTDFLNQSDLILQKHYSNKYNIVICGDVNVNYLIYNNYYLLHYLHLHHHIWRYYPIITGLLLLSSSSSLSSSYYNSRQLDAVLHSYNLAGIFKFPTRFGLNSHTAIDSVFIDTSTIGKYDLYPLINGLSDHDTQLLILNNGQKKEKECLTYIKRKINKYTLADFRLKLSHETWEQLFDENDVNKIFNSFLNIFLRIYNSIFSLIQAKN
jgi:hypothetical protein